MKKRTHQAFFKSDVSFLIVNKFRPLTRLEKLESKIKFKTNLPVKKIPVGTMDYTRKKKRTSKHR